MRSLLKWSGWSAVLAVSGLAMSGCGGVGPRGGPAGGQFDVRRYGAKGDGTTLDTDAVNAAIAAAADAGGGTVVFPAGVYPCHSVHLRSHVTLYLGPGSTLMAAAPAPAGSGQPTYDPPEPNPFDPYEDFGHSHFQNSLIWGENLEDVGIVGPGTIDGSRGLVRGSAYADGSNAVVGAGVGPEPPPRTAASRPRDRTGRPGTGDAVPAGFGNKAVSLKLCRRVLLRDFTLFAAGHFGLLATGTDDLTIDNLKIDTNRDGMDVDSCRGVRISNCSVNSPSDDGICLKADFALGYNRACEDVTITNCQVSGWVCGTLLDGRHLQVRPENDRDGGPFGRIKLGTESNGGFRNVTISNCVFDSCRGLALETVDGGRLEDVAVDNITMRHPGNSPIFLRLGSRLRGPPDVTTVGTLQRVNISNVVVYDADPRYASVIAGIRGYDVRDVTVSHVQIFARGGGAEATRDWATTRPAEREDRYPEPSMFGYTGAYGFYVRHTKGIAFDDVALHLGGQDLRPAFLLDDVDGAKFVNVDAEQTGDVSPLAGRGARNVTIRDFPGAHPPPATEPAGLTPATPQP